MRMAVKPIAIAAICISLLMQTGCWDKKQYEEIGFILQMGLEMDQKGKLLYSMTAPVVAPEVQSKVEFLHTSSERLIRASRERIRNVSGKLLQGGKAQHIYFSKDLAKKGISEFFEIFLRDPENPLLANVIVVDGSPKEMMELSLEYKDKPRSAFYVNELLRDAHRRSVAPETRIYDFSIMKHSKTIDPTIPFVRYSEKNIEIAGSALFSGDKMVGEINTDQTMLLNVLMGKNRDVEYIYRGNDLNESAEKIKRGEAVTIKCNKKKIQIDTGGKVPVINIKLKIKGVLDEYAGVNNFNEKESKKRSEEKLARSIMEENMKLLKYLQNLGADPIGFGEMVRAKQNKYWKSVQWKQVYKKAVFNVDVEVRFESFGTIN